MFYPLKNLLLHNLVILKLKCNNLIFNEMLVLYASYVCVCCIIASSRITQSGSWKTDPSFMRWLCQKLPKLMRDGGVVLIVCDHTHALLDDGPGEVVLMSSACTRASQPYQCVSQGPRGRTLPQGAGAIWDPPDYELGRA
jgi:hypothetical protein